MTCPYTLDWIFTYGKRELYMELLIERDDVEFDYFLTVDGVPGARWTWHREFPECCARAKAEHEVKNS